MNNFQVYEKQREDLHTEDEKDYKYDCMNCGQASTHICCSKSCYLICKADYEADQDK